MEENLGIACGRCDTFSPMGVKRCAGCGHGLSLFPSAAEAAPVEAPDQVHAHQSVESAEEEMQQTRYYVCKECSTPVPSGHKFCGACGATVPADVLERKVEFFGSMQAPGKARLILIRGTEGADGLSYILQGQDHVAGRSDTAIPFPNDPWVSQTHANFHYQGEKLLVRDEGSLNGVFLRVRGTVPVEPGTLFLCGEQVFRVDATPTDTAGPDPDQTQFYASPRRPSPFRIVQVLAGTGDGMTFCNRGEPKLTIGREDADMNFPDDVFMSGNHAEVSNVEGGGFTISDLNSRNGTYVRIRGEQELANGDYVFLGHQLLRVEQTV